MKVGNEGWDCRGPAVPGTKSWGLLVGGYGVPPWHKAIVQVRSFIVCDPEVLPSGM